MPYATSELALKFAGITDEAMVRHMFSNYRKHDEDNRGLRLTKFGLQIMKQYFRGFEILMPDGEKLKPSHLLYLDKKSVMPYYCDSAGFTVYDHNLGIKLKLADGKISTLIDIESEK